LKTGIAKVGEAKTKLISTVQVARRRYVHISDRETGKDIDWQSDSSLGEYWFMMTPDTEDDLNDQWDCLMTEDKDYSNLHPTRAMLDFSHFRKDKVEKASNFQGLP
jgi:hypothetical protein